MKILKIKLKKDLLIKEGVAWIDTQCPETQYWISSYFEGF